MQIMQILQTERGK